MIFGGLVATLVWAARRGFDLTDEGYYLQLIARPGDAPAVATQFNRLVVLLTGGWDVGIIGYRLAGMTWLVGSAILLAAGLRAVLRTFHAQIFSALPSRTVLFAFIAVLGLLGYAWLPLTPSYNILAAVLAQMAVGLTLFSLCRRGGPVGASAGAAVFEVMTGLSLALLFFVKWPAAPAVAMLMVVLVVGVLGWGRSPVPIALFLGSTFLWLLIITQGTAWFSLEDLFAGIRRTSASGHEPLELLAQYVSDLTEGLVAATLGEPIRLVALVVLFTGGLSKRPSRSGWLNPYRAVTFVGAVYLLFELRDAPYFARTAIPSFLVSVLVAVPIVAIVLVVTSRTNTGGEGQRLKPVRWLLVVLFCLPLAVSLGTDNSIFLGSLVAAAGYGGFLVVALAAMGIRWRGPSNLRDGLALPVLGVVLAAQVFHGVVVDPYRLPTPRWEQTQSVNGIARMRGILLDPAGATFIEDVHRVVLEDTGFRPGERIVAFAKLPGLVYMLDGVGPGQLWIQPPETGRQGAACASMYADAASVSLTRLILQNDRPSAELEHCLRELVPGYPQDFVVVGEVPIPGDYGAGTGAGTVLEVLELRER